MSICSLSVWNCLPRPAKLWVDLEDAVAATEAAAAAALQQKALCLQELN